MRYWRTIVREIHLALFEYEHTVQFHKSIVGNFGEECAYFEIAINEDYDRDEIECELQEIVDDWELDFDWIGSNADLDLNASWDCDGC